MEMRADGTCSILNDDCPEVNITDCRECQLYQTVEDYREKIEILNDLKRELIR